MTLFFEISKPYQPRFQRYDSDIMRRYWFLWFAFGWLKVPFVEFSKTSYIWEKTN